ncbi:ECF RNA polymerase sigma factor SigM [termite gut metagenome]|uniref:ECF RNA polymerase sigma factor SigM n=1 Tax=termite gut metagenome TaxID=433724 RepID=A0A5J4S8Q5_9ZZZZ
MKQKNMNLMMQNKNVDATTRLLLSAFQSGDISAFSKLYNLHINILFNYGYKLTTDKELLKDCIHDVFVRLYSRRNELRDIENLKAYLFVSLKNRLYDESKKRSYISDTAVEEIEPLSPDDVEHKFLNKEKESIQNMMVINLLSQLSPRQREALVLYYIEERKYEDICGIMKMNYQSVRNLMYRGLTKLRNIVG